MVGRTEDILSQADERLAGVRGGIALARERQGGLSRRQIENWVRRLREAADRLEMLT